MNETVRVEVSFSPEILEFIDRQAEWLGMTRTTYIRQAAVRCAAADDRPARVMVPRTAPEPASPLSVEARIRAYFDRRPGVRSITLRDAVRSLGDRHGVVTTRTLRDAFDSLEAAGYGTVSTEIRGGRQRTIFTRKE